MKAKEALKKLDTWLFGYEFDKCICKNPHCEAHEINISNKIKELIKEAEQ